MINMRSLLIGLILSITAYPVMSRIDVHEFDSEEKTARYKVLINELRCLVCQNQNIADSNADLAKDLRQQIFEMIQAGKSDDEIADYMVDRYGDFVLYRPPVKPLTYLLWGGPFLLLVAGGVVVYQISVKRKTQESITVDGAQRERASELLRDKDSDA